MLRTVAEGRHASRMRIAAERLQRSKPRIESNCCIGVLRSVSRSERHDVHRRRVLPRTYATTWKVGQCGTMYIRAALATFSICPFLPTELRQGGWQTMFTRAAKFLRQHSMDMHQAFPFHMFAECLLLELWLQHFH